MVTNLTSPLLFSCLDQYLDFLMLVKHSGNYSFQVWEQHEKKSGRWVWLGQREFVESEEQAVLLC